MEQEKESQDEFEKITLSNLWLKNHVLEVMAKIDFYEAKATDGVNDISDGILLTPEQQEVGKFDSFKLMRTQIDILSGNVTPYLENKEVIKQIRLIMFVSNRQHKDSELLAIGENHINHTRWKYLTDKFYPALNTLRNVKLKLYNEIANSELLMPKKSDKENEDIEDE